MSVIIPISAYSEISDIHEQIFDYWNDLAGDNGATTLNELYQRGVVRRPADRYLWNLDPQQEEFTIADIDELDTQVDLINASDYPKNLKDAMSNLLSILRKAKINKNINSKAKNQAIRNFYESRTYQGAAPGQGPANVIRNFVGITLPKKTRRIRSRKVLKRSKVRKSRHQRL